MVQYIQLLHIKQNIIKKNFKVKYQKLILFILFWEESQFYTDIFTKNDLKNIIFTSRKIRNT
jgi:hypothetical protein